MKRGGIAILAGAAIALAGCSSTGPASSTGSTTPPIAAPTTPPASTHSADPNVAACRSAHRVLLRVKAAIRDWHPYQNLYDQSVATKLRDAATSLYGPAAQAHGAAATAMHHEASALIDLSVALSTNDPNVASAANRSNSSLAEVRGTCGF